MFKSTKQLTLVVVAISLAMFAFSGSAKAQYPVVVNSVAPVVVGHRVEPAGLFGWRTRIRPVVAPVVTPVALAPVPVTSVPVTRPVTIVPSPTAVVRFGTPSDVPAFYAPGPIVTTTTYTGL